MIKSQLRFKIIFLVLLITIISNIYAQTVNIKIIETSDVHGAIYPYNFNSNKPSKNSLAQVYTYVEKERVNNNQSVFLVDNGDILQGDPSVYYYNFENDIVIVGSDGLFDNVYVTEMLDLIRKTNGN